MAGHKGCRQEMFLKCSSPAVGNMYLANQTQGMVASPWWRFSEIAPSDIRERTGADMTDPKGVERAHGLDIPVGQARKQFAKVTKEELDAAGLPSVELLAEGERQTVVFKNVEVRKVFHN